MMRNEIRERRTCQRKGREMNYKKRQITKTWMNWREKRLKSRKRREEVRGVEGQRFLQTSGSSGSSPGPEGAG